jgi:iron complex outermembrane receptor protein
MQWFAITANEAGNFPAAPGAATRVTGIRYDTDPRGLRRALFGGNGGAIDHTKQDTAKVRMGYAVKSIDISGVVAGWRNDTANRNTTFLRDTAGAEIWQGRVTDGLNQFNIPATAFAPSLREELHLQSGVTVRSERPAGWNGSFVISDYRILDDASRQANSADPIAANGGVGTVTRRDGTGWGTMEGQARYTPVAGGRHALTFGVHRNAYRLLNVVNNASDWRSVETTLSQNYAGRSNVKAFYAQDVVTLRQNLKLTVGWRAEWFETWDGGQVARLSSCTSTAGVVCAANGDGTFNKIVSYPRRSLSGQSPKASISWTADDDLLIRVSAGRGVRFPNVEELYNGTVTATSVIVSDPDLKAERSNAFELSAEKFWTNHMLRSTFFLDDVRDAILRQSDSTVTPSITRVSNMDRARTPGLEFVWVANDFGVRGVNVEGNLTLASAKVVENRADPESEGKYWLRVPKTRGTITMAYRPTDRWMGSIAYRHHGRSFNDVYNRDTNSNVFGGVSSVNQVDVRLSYKPIALTEIAFGIDNVTDSIAYAHHPYPGRTLFVELRVAPK